MKRALRSKQRVLLFTKRALHSMEKALYSIQRALKEPYILATDTSIPWTEPYSLPKEPCILTKEPCIPWKEPYILSKELWSILGHWRQGKGTAKESVVEQARKRTSCRERRVGEGGGLVPTYVTWYIHRCDMTPFTCVTWLGHMCDMTHLCATILS